MECLACHQPNVDGASFCAKCGAPLPRSRGADNDPLIGSIVGGRFRVTEVLGEGGMGRVYSGEQQMGTSVRKVAIKTLLAQFAKDPETVARFMRECGTVAELEHPNTIKVYDFGQTPTGELYIAMELLTGQSLESVLEREGALSAERVDRILGQVCGSLQEAHDKGIIHRDLKPANIQLSVRAGESDYVKVLDFGIAKRGSGSTKQEQKLTQQGKILGTPPYMSPEQFKGGDLDARSDIYSLGIMAYEMLTHRLPFDADTPWAWATQHMTAQPFPFETVPIAMHVPPKMRAAVMRALSKNAAERQQTVREFYDELTSGAGPRASMLGATRASASHPDIAAYSVGARPGQTQVGEPVFAPPTPPQRTVMDQAPTGGPSPGAVPTTGGQAVPAVPSAPKRSAGPLIGVGAVALIGAIAGAAVLWTRRGADADVGGIALPSATASTLVPADPPAQSAVPTTAVATTKPPATSTKPATTADSKGDAACEAAINLANGTNVVLAVAQFRNCTGPKRGAAKATIDAAGVRAARKPACSGKADAQAAASIGAGAGMAALDPRCKK